MRIYKANKIGPAVYLLAGYFMFLVFLYANDPNHFFQKTHWFYPFALPVFLNVWALFYTYYKIEGNKLFYRSGYIHGEIDISCIKEIVKGKTRWIGFKPALATNGIIVKYNRYDDVYIAAKNNDALIADLQKLNANITLVEEKKIAN